MNSDKIAAVVLRHNGYEITIQTLLSLYAVDYENLDFFLAENGSTDKKTVLKWPQSQGQYFL
jgi:hypothetical protein